MIFLSTLITTLFGALLMAQEIEGIRSRPEYTASGKLLILRVVPQDRTAKIFVVGSKIAEVDLKRDTKILSVHLRDPETETLQLNSRGEYYEVNGIPNKGQPYKLSIKARVRDQSEVIPVVIQPKVP